MSNEEKGKATGEVEKIIETSTAQLRAERDALIATIGEQDKQIKDLTVALSQMKNEMNAQNKSKLIDKLRPLTKYDVSYLVELDVPQLESLIEAYEYAKVPTFRSGANLSATGDKYAKLHNMFKFGKK